MTRKIAGRRCLALLGLAVLGTASIAAADRDLRIVEAAKNADWAAVPALLKQRADVNAPQADGTTALQWAAYWDEVTSADVLLRAGAKVNAANDLGVTPLWAAAENGSAAMIQRLLQAGANPNAPLLSGETPLMTAARTGNADVVRQLLTKGADANAKEHEYDQTALMWAVAEKHSAVVELLLAHRADVNARAISYTKTVKTTPEQASRNVTDIQEGGYTPLLFAARVGDLASAKLLVAAGANVNDTAAAGTSATLVAAHSGHGDVAAYLLEKGADPNAAGAGYTPLHAAIVRRDERLAAALLAAGADANAKLLKPTASRRQAGDVYMAPAFVGATPFWLAARYYSPNTMRLLAKHGADPLFVHHPDYWSQGGGYEDVRIVEGATTTLMAAAGMGHRLFGWEGDPEVDPDVIEAQTLEAVKVAIGLGVDIHAANADGNTALHTAAGRGHDSVVKYLMEKGARMDVKNRRGQTPMEAAKAGARRPF